MVDKIRYNMFYDIICFMSRCMQLTRPIIVATHVLWSNDMFVHERDEKWAVQSSTVLFPIVYCMCGLM